MFQSTHSMKSATFHDFGTKFKGVVSIHALNEECDPTHNQLTHLPPIVSIHALNEECDVKTLSKMPLTP